MENSPPVNTSWPFWQKIAFRFCFILFIFLANPVYFVSMIPGLDKLVGFYYDIELAVTQFFNQLLFHIQPAVRPPNGNGDYPEQWMAICTYLLIALAGCLVWSLLDRKRRNYARMNYWLCLIIRYFIILNGITYGVIKMFGLQMPFPSLSQLATPLGDFLPMRFSWMFVGYSPSYQFFSGSIEVLAAVLLLFRKTATAGILVATGVFLNVMMLNLSYDIPVKINSIALVLLCLYLLLMELPRLYFFFFKQEARPSPVFIFPFTKKWQRYTAAGIKWVFILLVIFLEIKRDRETKQARASRPHPVQIQQGIYDVLLQVNSGDTISAAGPDSVYWQNIVFDIGNTGSIKATDSRFMQRYGRGYFSFAIDTFGHYLTMTPVSGGKVIAHFSYQFRDSITLELNSYPKSDSMHLLIRRRIKPFPLSEKPFHWVSETNR